MLNAAIESQSLALYPSTPNFNADSCPRRTTSTRPHYFYWGNPQLPQLIHPGLWIMTHCENQINHVASLLKGLLDPGFTQDSPQVCAFFPNDPSSCINYKDRHVQHQHSAHRWLVTLTSGSKIEVLAAFMTSMVHSPNLKIHRKRRCDSSCVHNWPDLVRWWKIRYDRSSKLSWLITDQLRTVHSKETSKRKG